MITYESIRARLKNNFWVFGSFKKSDNELVSLGMIQDCGKYKLETIVGEGYDVFKKHDYQWLPDRFFETFEALQDVLEKEFNGLDAFRFKSEKKDDYFTHVFECWKTDNVGKLDREVFEEFLENDHHFDLWYEAMKRFQKENGWHELNILISFLRGCGGYHKEETEQKIVERLCEIFVEAVNRFDKEINARSWHAWTTYAIMDYLFLTPSAADYLTDAFYHAMKKVLTWKPAGYSGNTFMTMYWGYSVIFYHENPFQEELEKIVKNHPDEAIREMDE